MADCMPFTFDGNKSLMMNWIIGFILNFFYSLTFFVSKPPIHNLLLWTKFTYDRVWSITFFFLKKYFKVFNLFVGFFTLSDSGYSSEKYLLSLISEIPTSVQNLIPNPKAN